MTRSRFPSSVYGVGDEPDPRFSLANERTFLAWIRTALALLAVGIGVAALATPIHPVLRFVAALTFIALALLAAVSAWASWSRDERALRTGAPLHGPGTGLVVVIGVVVASGVLVVGMFV